LSKLQDKILVYKCGELDDGAPVYAVACNVDEIPEDVDGKQVGIYILNRQTKFKVKRELI
jgi:hypothetical protein